MKLTKKQQDEIKKAGQKHKLDFIILHGSQATGKKGIEPDVDVAIYRQGGIDFQEQLKIFMKLSSVFEDLGELDLKTLHKKDLLFRYLVVNEGLLLYGDEMAFNEYKAYALRTYYDAYDLFALEDYLIKKYQKELTTTLHA